MAFVIEKLTEKDLEYFNSFKFIQPVGGQGKELACPRERWIIDHDQGIILVCLGGQGWKWSEEYPPDYYRMIFPNRAVIEIEAWKTWDGTNTTGMKFRWKIRHIVVPYELREMSQGAIDSVIKEAFTKEAYRGGFDNELNVLSVEFESIGSPMYLKQ